MASRPLSGDFVGGETTSNSRELSFYDRLKNSRFLSLKNHNLCFICQASNIIFGIKNSGLF